MRKCINSYNTKRKWKINSKRHFKDKLRIITEQLKESFKWKFKFQQLNCKATYRSMFCLCQRTNFPLAQNGLVLGANWGVWWGHTGYNYFGFQKPGADNGLKARVKVLSQLIFFTLHFFLACRKGSQVRKDIEAHVWLWGFYCCSVAESGISGH